MKDKRSLKLDLGNVLFAGAPTATCSGVPTAIMFTNKLVIKNFLSISMLSQYLPMLFKYIDKTTIYYQYNTNTPQNSP